MGVYESRFDLAEFFPGHYIKDWGFLWNLTTINQLKISFFFSQRYRAQEAEKGFFEHKMMYYKHV